MSEHAMPAGPRVVDRVIREFDGRDEPAMIVVLTKGAGRPLTLTSVPRP
jgi:hypothetical protein